MIAVQLYSVNGNLIKVIIFHDMAPIILTDAVDNYDVSTSNHENYYIL